ncbi:MAG: sigma-70 family RNA polymerase sigma factor [Acidimicrobiales bacterium]|nr:sigma-70 family RNA polymerase sigma factor [Acidimicrobiales bacterium]MDP6285390.1 sigma-70 family RNA polymerase sigma factor [Acidimicrobiales bacterium]HJO40745.1 sigma-70 family RNA polymerase sigma factor [Acidimicrobiales bacterium]
MLKQNKFEASIEDTPEFRRERFRVLYNDLYDDLWRYVQRRSINTEEARDTLSEVFLVAWRRLEDIPAGKEARLWLFGVARNLVKTSWRKRKRGGDLVVRIGSEMSTRGATDEELDNSGVLKIVKALQFLSENDQEILRLLAWENLSHKEISVVLGCSENAVAIRIRRARVRLMKVLQSEKSFSEINNLKEIAERFSPETTSSS